MKDSAHEISGTLAPRFMVFIEFLKWTLSAFIGVYRRLNCPFNWFNNPEVVMKSRHKLILVAAAGALLGAAAAEVIHAQANTPPAFLIAEIKVNDPDGYKAYLAKVSPVTDAFGGRFIVRGGKTESIEGAEPTGRVAIIQFRSMEELKRYWNSPAYQEIAPIRLKTATSRIYFVEGVAP